MANTIRILSKKAFRFKRPGVGLLDVNEGISKQPEFKDTYFDTVPGEIQDAPSWIKSGVDNINTWTWATGDGDIVELKMVSKSKVTDPKVAAAMAQSETAQRGLAQEPPDDDNAESGGQGGDDGDGITMQTEGTPEPQVDTSPASDAPKSNKAAPAKGKGK